MPAIRRDLSLAVAADLNAERLGDRVRDLLGEDANRLDEITVLSETSHDDLPYTAGRHMGLRPGQKNILLRNIIRDLRRSMTTDEANQSRERLYAALYLELRERSWL